MRNYFVCALLLSQISCGEVLKRYRGEFASADVTTKEIKPESEEGGKIDDKGPTETPMTPSDSMDDEGKKDPTDPMDTEIPKDPGETQDPEIPKPWEPCPPKGEACRILPFGDSITWGMNGYKQGGYRVPLFKKAVSAGKSITFVGSMSTGPDKVGDLPFPKANEGHRGWAIEDIKAPNGTIRDGISKIVEESLGKNKPHIILLQIGTNDVIMNAEMKDAPERLSKLLDRIAKQSPEALIVVAQIVPNRHSAREERTKVYNAALPAIIEKKAKAGMHVVKVDMHSPIIANKNWKTELFSDDAHPKDAGFDIMANVWWSAIDNYLK